MGCTFLSIDMSSEGRILLLFSNPPSWRMKTSLFIPLQKNILTLLRNRHKTEIPKENKDHLYEGRLFFFLTTKSRLSLLLPKYKKLQSSITFQLKLGLWHHLYGVKLQQTSITQLVLRINEKKMTGIYCLLQFVQTTVHFTEWGLNANCGNLRKRKLNWLKVIQRI